MNGKSCLIPLINVAVNKEMCKLSILIGVCPETLPTPTPPPPRNKKTNKTKRTKTHTHKQTNKQKNTHTKTLTYYIQHLIAVSQVSDHCPLGILFLISGVLLEIVWTMPKMRALKACYSASATVMTERILIKFCTCLEKQYKNRVPINRVSTLYQSYKRTFSISFF